jgi:hypothetical protein
MWSADVQMQIQCAGEGVDAADGRAEQIDSCNSISGMTVVFRE